ncbi:MAG: hypothetical protein J3K34DRAFT_401521 [Monoraphidium minutum]|nr:MAG: hypothetical protein J3K34DRAFT_401521 [Monoraphidium minutum]
MPRRAPLLAPLLALLLAAAAPAPTAGRKVWATLPYTVKGQVTRFLSDGVKGQLDVGGHLVMDLELLQDGAPSGRLYGTCRAVGAAPGGGVRAACTKHYEWDGGATAMVAHSTEVFKGGGAPVNARIMIVGGIGKWQGAHGEDLEFTYDPKTGQGSGKILLYCLDGRC